MQSTFALRRKEIISDDLPVADILERWPALKMESQICAEFHRITNINLKNHFFAVLDQHTPHLQSIFRKKASRTGKASDVLGQLFTTYDLQEQVDVHVRRAVVLQALPAYLHEDTSSFLRTCDDGQSREPDVVDTPLGLLAVGADPQNAMFHPVKILLYLRVTRLLTYPHWLMDLSCYLH
ncbi:hypothetical protein OJAV_G00008470 [Oryzias javanicus]|uniref:Uncharacterized protein n=1 Tax=Oryzias javanicus TaxID=123683 RepID=A0A3S5K3H7_ORYJA|nr:hypothetical protein OJAV_G00008470 [Oryzias javanicus]